VPQHKSIEALTNHKIWFDFSRQQKKVAEALLDSITQGDLLLRAKEEGNFDEYITIFSNAHYHWGIAIENGFKALIIKHQPSSVKYEISNGEVIVKAIGPKAGKTHDLLQLAEVVGIFKQETGLYKTEEESKPLKEVLRHLTDMIRWGARYPLPMNSANTHKFSGNMPSVLVYGFHILDVMDPLFELFDNEDEYMLHSDATINIIYKKRIDQPSILSLLSEIEKAIDSGHKSINIFIDTHGGEFPYAIEFYDKLQPLLLKAKFSVYNSGKVESCGMVLYLAFKKNRFTLPSHNFMIHSTRKKSTGEIDEFSKHCNTVMADILIKKTKMGVLLFNQSLQTGIDENFQEKVALNFEIAHRVIPTLPEAPETVFI
jgi:ATP-dependent protease ClpP protease subunit